MNRLTQLSKYLILLVLLAVPFLICGQNEQSPFELIKLIFICTMTISSVQIYLLADILKEKIEFRWNISLSLIFLIVLATTISYLFANNQFTAFWGNYNIPSDSLLSVLIYFLFCIILIQNFKTTSDLKKLNLSLMVSSFFLGAYGIVQHFGLDPIDWWGYSQMHLNAYGTIGQAVGFATILGAIFPLTLTTYFFEDRKVYKYLLLVVLLTLLLGIMYSGSRMPMVLTIVLSLTLSCLYLLKTRSRTALKKAGLFLGVLFLSQAIYYGENDNALTHKLKPQIVSTGIQERIQVWRDSIKIWQKYPIIGSGPENFALELKLVNTKDFNTNQNWALYWHKAHNHLIHYLATIGFVGLLTHLSLASFLFFFIFKLLFKKKLDEDDLLESGYLFGFLFIFLANMTAFNFVVTQLYYLMFPVLFCAVRFSNIKIFTLKIPKFLNIINTLMALTLLGLFNYEIIRFWNADRYFSSSRRYLELNKNMNLAIKYINKAIATKPNDCRFYLRKSSLVTSIVKYQAKNNLKWNPESSIRDLEELTDRGLECDKKNPETWFYRARLFAELYENNIINSTDIAEKSFIEGEKLAPANPIFSYNLALLYLNSRRDLGFLEKMNHTLDLKPDYLLAYTQLLKYFYNEKKQSEVEAILLRVSQLPFISGEFLPELKNLAIVSTLNNDYKSAAAFTGIFDKFTKNF